MAELPRVTQILKDHGLIDVTWFAPKHSRRGRLVDHICNMVGRGEYIDGAWWDQHSGEAENDRVEHRECEPYVDQYRRFLSETGFQMKHCAIEVRNSVARYVGHIDELGELNGRVVLVDIKTGGESKWHRWQLGGYSPAVVETLHLPVAPVRANLYLNPDNYRLVERKDRSDIHDFLAFAHTWHCING